MKLNIWPLALALLACDAGSSGPAVAPAQPAPDDAQVAAKAPPTPAAPTPTPAPAGPAYLATEKAVIKLEGGQFTPLKDSPRGILHFATGQGGAVYMASEKAVYKLAGDAVTLLPKPSVPTHISNIQVAPGGELWAVGFAGFAIWDGQRWESTKAKAVGPGVDSFEDVTFDAAGVPFLTATRQLFTRGVGGWAELDLTALSLDVSFFDEAVTAPDGGVLLSYNGGVIHKGDGPWVSLPIDASLGKEDTLAVGKDGTVYSASSSGALNRLKGNAVTELNKDNKLWLGYDIHALAVDGAGRVWLSTDAGVAVGVDTFVQWPPGSVPSIDGKVQAIYVMRGGPVLPTEVKPVVGSVKGRLLRQGKAIADAPIELCGSSAFMFKTSPCEGQPLRRETTTDKAGRFTLGEVPFGRQSIVMKIDDKWTNVLGVHCCTKMTPGGTVDLGDVDLKD